jgi:hypothetical protein
VIVTDVAWLALIAESAIRFERNQRVAIASAWRPSSSLSRAVERAGSTRFRNEHSGPRRDGIGIRGIGGGHAVELGQPLGHDRQLLGEPEPLGPLLDNVGEQRGMPIEVALLDHGAGFLGRQELIDPQGGEVPALGHPPQTGGVRTAVRPLVAHEQRKLAGDDGVEQRLLLDHLVGHDVDPHDPQVARPDVDVRLFWDRRDLVESPRSGEPRTAVLAYRLEGETLTVAGPRAVLRRIPAGSTTSGPIRSQPSK